MQPTALAVPGQGLCTTDCLVALYAYAAIRAQVLMGLYSHGRTSVLSSIFH